MSELIPYEKHSKVSEMGKMIVVFKMASNDNVFCLKILTSNNEQ